MHTLLFMKKHYKLALDNITSLPSSNIIHSLPLALHKPHNSHKRHKCDCIARVLEHSLPTAFFWEQGCFKHSN